MKHYFIIIILVAIVSITSRLIIYASSDQKDGSGQDNRPENKEDSLKIPVHIRR